MTPSYRRLFQNRMAKRAFRHGKNWRQVYINCGGMCLLCYEVDGLEFHEPFGEDKFGWNIFQSRVLLCHDCHMDKEHENLFTESPYLKPSRLQEDVNIEILIHGGYDQWIKDFKLEDTPARWLL